jgi:hypothetical protein
MKNTGWILSAVIGVILLTSAFPMIVIPFMGVSIVIWALYLLIYRVIWPAITGKNPNKKNKMRESRVS